PPFSESGAVRLVDAPASAIKLRGTRGLPPADREALADLVVRIGLLAEDLPELASLELYPVLVAQHGLTVVGARARRAPAPTRPARCLSTPARPRPSWDNIGMTTALPSDLLEDLETAGYFPQTAARSLERLLRTARPVAHLVRPETTFDGPEVRRHLTVVVLADTHL